MEHIIIEYVFTENYARSQITEAVALDYIYNKGLGEKISVISTGTMTDMLRNDLFHLPFSKLIYYIETGLKNNVLERKARSYAKKILADKDRILISVISDDEDTKNKLKYCMESVIKSAIRQRKTVLNEAKLYKSVTSTIQTLPVENVDLILAINQEALDFVKRLYTGFNHNPPAATMAEYAGTHEEIPELLGKDIQEYRKTLKVLSEIVKKTIDRAVEEFHLS